MDTRSFLAQTSNWAPLIDLVGEQRAQAFSFVGNDGEIMVYKHYMTHRLLNVHMYTRQTFRFVGDQGYVPIPPEVAIASAFGPRPK